MFPLSFVVRASARRLVVSCQRLQVAALWGAALLFPLFVVAAGPCVNRAWNIQLPPPSIVDGWFYDSTVWDDGSGRGPMLYAVGFFALPEGDGWADGVARWNGTAWEAVGHGVGYTTHTGYPEVHAITVHDGDLIIGGDFTRVGDVPANNIARWDGTHWHPLGPGFNEIVYALGSYNGQLVAGRDGGVAWWDGATWSSGLRVFGTVRAVAEYNGELVIAGDMQAVLNGTVSTGAARWNGSTWLPLNVGGWVWALTVYNGELIAGGLFGAAGGVPAGSIARWNGSRWASLAAANALNGEVHALAEFEGALLVGGSFSAAAGIPSGLVAQWNAGGSGAWSSVGGGLFRLQVDDFVTAFSVMDSTLFAVGRFYDRVGTSYLPQNWARWMCSDTPNLAPVADVGGPYAGQRGAPTFLNGNGSFDPDGAGTLSYFWNFGDGSTTTSSAAGVVHTYATAGAFTVTLSVFDGQLWSAPASTTAIITAPNALPTVAITSPVANATFTTPATIAITASASDPDGTVAQVEFFAGMTSLGIDFSPPYSVTWSNAPGGRHTLTAVARDNLGATRTSSAIGISVETVVAPMADAYVRGGTNANRNFGAATSLEVRTSTSANTRWTYLRFDTRALATVSNARLRLFGAVSATSGSSVRTAAYGASNVTWGETTLTWNNKPASGAVALATVTMANSRTPRWYEWDLTSYLQQERAAGRPIVTIVLKNTTTTTANDLFAAREASTNRPYLALMP